MNNNNNKRKLWEFLKKIKIVKVETSNMLKEIEFERMKIKELKISIYHDLSKNVDDMLKNDD